MKIIWKAFFLGLVGISSCLAWSHSKTQLTLEEGYPVQVETIDTQRNKVELSFATKPQRAIAYHQNNIETFLQLNELERLIAAQGRYIGITPEEQRFQQQLLPRLNYYGQHGINQEMAVFLQPDLILGWPSSFSGRGVWSLGATDFWQQRGVQCYITTQLKPRRSMETVVGEMKYVGDMGKIFQKEHISQAYITELSNYMEAIRHKYAGEKPQRVLVLDIYGNTIGAYRKDRVVGDIITQLGGEVVNISRWPSKEEILFSNPDVIFLIYKTNAEISIKEHFLQERVYQGLQAVQKGRVYTVPLTFILNSGWRTMDGVKVITKGMYPQASEEDS